MLGPDALAWRDRHYGQSSCPQGRRRARENRGNRRNAAAPTPLFSRSQSDRAVLRKTQSSPAQVLRALHPRPLGSNRNNPPDLHSRRVQQLLHTRRIWAKMRGIRSKFYNMKIEFHQRLIAISTLLLSRPQPGVDYGALAAEAPKTTASLEYIDRSLFEATPLIFATLIDQTPDKNGKVSHLIITRAERQHLLVALSLHFGQKMDLENQSYIVSSASVLKSYLLQYKCSDE